MRCPELNSYIKEICVSGGTLIFPSPKHLENFCMSGSHWACPMKTRHEPVTGTDAVEVSI